VIGFDSEQMRYLYSSAALILANIVLLFGVSALGWSLSSVLIAYWTEAVIVGVFNIGKMLLSTGDRVLKAGSRFWTIVLFVFHYSLYLAVYIMLIFFFFFLFLPEVHPLDHFGPVPVAAAAFALSHGFSLWLNYSKEREFARVQSLTFQPYIRLFVVHSAVLAGAVIIVLSDKQSLLPILVLGKTILDMLFHMMERFIFKPGNARGLTLEFKDEE